MKLDPQHQLIIDFIDKTNRPIFMTGKAGTGKTTFLRYIQSSSKKNLAVVAPTAVAAINAGGVTIHSFFQVPFGPIPPVSSNNTFSEFSGKNFGIEKAKLIKCLELLIIDEISMVRADTIDYIDRVLKFIKGNILPFGGVQILMIGDLYQLPPVFQNDWHVLGKFYTGPYFFDSLIFKKHALLTFELEKVHRQSDPTFIEILNEIRNGSINELLLKKLNENITDNAGIENLADHVTLTTHNPLVKKINEERLQELPGEMHHFLAKVDGDFPKEAFPTEEELVLKAGAMVMFIKNDSSGKKQFYNGRTAKIDSINGEVIRLTFLDDGSGFEASQETWENSKYTLSENDQKVSQTSAGSFTQFPLRLAWAITIHKSQGLTFDKAVIDVGAAFAHGQTYVALSRCRSLQGLILKEKVAVKNIITDPSVRAFMEKAKSQLPDKDMLENSMSALKVEILISIFDFSVIHSAWNHLKTIMTELLPSEAKFIEELKTTQHLLDTKISPIGDRFIRQELQTLDGRLALVNIKIRLTKSSGYFLPQLLTFHERILASHQMLVGTPFHNEYFPTLNMLLAHLEERIEVFKLLPNLNHVHEISEIIKDKVTGFKTIDSWKQKENPAAIIIENPIIYAELIDWRERIAAIKNSLGYHIISDQAMADISAKLPRTLTQLSKIKNVGEGKAAEYGEQLLKIIGKHLGENQLF